MRNKNFLRLSTLSYQKALKNAREFLEKINDWIVNGNPSDNITELHKDQFYKVGNDLEKMSFPDRPPVVDLNDELYEKAKKLVPARGPQGAYPEFLEKIFKS